MPNEHENRSNLASIDKFNRIYHQRLCLLPEGANTPGHPCVGVNRVTDFDGFFNIRDIIKSIKTHTSEPEIVAFSDIWLQLHRPGEKEIIIQNDPRYQNADISFPGILTKIKNPDNKRFRMLDGRRRLWKQEENGAIKGWFYIIPETTVFNFFWMVISQSSMRETLNKIHAETISQSQS